MDNLTSRVQRLVTQLTAQEAPGRAAAPPDPPTTETAYRQTLWRWFELGAQGAGADREEVARVYQDLLRLIDEVGEPRATSLRRQWVRDWWQETGACPYCGERGPCHDPHDDGEPPGQGSVGEPE